MTTLVTGGSGYIGSHVVRLLRARGDRVVVVDEVRGRGGDDATAFTQLDLVDPAATGVLVRLLEDEGVDAVIHFAARKRVDESVVRPVWYYQQNVGGLASVLEAVRSSGVRRFVFSSSAAVYGSPAERRVAEQAPAVPINPYGRTKLVGEWMLGDAARAHGLAAASLRYFNVAGAGWPDLGDAQTLNLITIVFDRILRGLPPLVFGGDFETPDGSGVRDYVHVLDLARAHIAALDHLDREGHAVFNVGTGTGTSVLEALAVVAEVSGIAFTPRIEARRPGDPAAVVADVGKIARELGWHAQQDFRSIVSSAWEALLHARAG